MLEHIIQIQNYLEELQQQCEKWKKCNRDDVLHLGGNDQILKHTGQGMTF